MSDGGKGSTPRPYSVPLKEYDSNWDRIFGNKEEKKTEEDNNQHNSDNH